MGIKKTALEMISLVEIFNLEKNIFPPVLGKFYTGIVIVTRVSITICITPKDLARRHGALPTGRTRRTFGSNRSS